MFKNITLFKAGVAALIIFAAIVYPLFSAPDDNRPHYVYLPAPQTRTVTTRCYGSWLGNTYHENCNDY